MKRMIVSVLVMFLAVQGAFASGNGEVKRGVDINAKGAISTKEMVAKMQKDKAFTGKVEAKISACCKKKGCWMTVDLGNGEEMRVTFKDYGFFVPLESAGKTVVMQGRAYYDTTTVADLQHYAKDGGKPQAEIDAITKPEISLGFEADGLILRDEKKK